MNCHKDCSISNNVCLFGGKEGGVNWQHSLLSGGFMYSHYWGVIWNTLLMSLCWMHNYQRLKKTENQPLKSQWKLWWKRVFVFVFCSTLNVILKLLPSGRWRDKLFPISLITIWKPQEKLILYWRNQEDRVKRGLCSARCKNAIFIRRNPFP